MKVLLDTHAFVWALRSPQLLSHHARQTVQVQRDVTVSAVSLFEIATRVRAGRWPEAAALLEYNAAFFAAQGFNCTDLGYTAAVRAGLMAGEHRDPFDRLIAATALEMNAALVSADAALDVFGVRRIW